MGKTLVLIWVLLIRNLNFSFIFWFLSLLLWMQRSVSPKPYETCCIWWVIYNNCWCLIVNHAKYCKEAVLTKNMGKTHTGSSWKIKTFFFSTLFWKLLVLLLLCLDNDFGDVPVFSAITTPSPYWLDFF